MHMRACPASEAYLNAGGHGLHDDAADARHDRADAVEHGGDAQHRLGAGAGRAISWPISGIAIDKRDLIARIDGWVGAARPGSLLYHPYISEAGERGPFVNNHARAGFNGLSLGHRFPDLMRAVVEGLGLAARDCYAAMGPIDQRGAVDRRRGTIARATRHPGGLSECARARRHARGGGRGGRGDDRGVARSARTAT